MLRVLIVALCLTSSVHSFRKKNSKESVLVNKEDSGCEEVVSGARALNNRRSAADCQCPALHVLSGEDEACSAIFGELVFDSSFLAGKSCRCAGIVDLFLHKTADVFGGIGRDAEASIVTLDAWLQDVKSKVEGKAADLEEKWVEVQEGVDQNLQKLKLDFRNASQHQKAEIKDQMRRLKSKFHEVRRALEENLREGIKQARGTARDMYHELKEELKAARTATDEKKAELKQSAQALKVRMLEMHASAIGRIPSRQALEVATELIADKVGQLKEQRRQAWANWLKQHEIDKKLKRLKEQRQLLQSAAINKGKEIGAGTARFVEVTAARIGELREQAQSASAEAKAAIENKISEHRAELDEFRAAASAQRVEMRTKLSKAIEGLSDDIGELQERRQNAWAWQEDAIKEQIQKFKARLGKLRSSVYQKQAEAEARLEVVISSVSSSIGELKMKARSAAAEKKADIQENIDDLQAVLVKLKAATVAKHNRLKEHAVVFSGLLTKEIQVIEERLKTATSDSKATLEAELAEFRDMLDRQGDALVTLKHDVDEILKPVIAQLKVALVKASEPTRVYIKDKIARLEEQRQLLQEDASQALGEATTVLAEHIGELQGEAKEQFEAYLEELQAASASAGARLEASLADAVELLSESRGRLQASLVTFDKKKNDAIASFFNRATEGRDKIETQLTKTREGLERARAVVLGWRQAKEEELAEVIATIAEDMGKLQEQAAGAGKEWAQEAVEELQSHLATLKANAASMRAELEVQLIDVAGTVSEQIGEFKSKVSVVAGEQKIKFKENVLRLEDRLQWLRAAGAEKYDEGRRAFEKVSDSMNERLGELREKAETAAESEREKLQMRLDVLEEHLESIQVAGQSIAGKVQENMDIAAGKICTLKGKLHEQLKVAAAAKQAEIQEDLTNLDAQLKRLRTSMTAKVRSRLAEVYTHLSERMTSLKLQLETAAAEEKVNIQAKIENLKGKIEMLNTAIANRRAAAVGLLEDLASKMKNHRLQLTEELAVARADAKVEIEQRLTQAAALVDELEAELEAAMADQTEQAEEALRAVAKRFRDEMRALKITAAEHVLEAGYAFVDTVSEWLAQLEAAVDDEGTADVVGAATTSDVTEELIADLPEHSSSLADVTSSDDSLEESLENCDVEVMRVVEERAEEANCDEVPCTPNGATNADGVPQSFEVLFGPAWTPPATRTTTNAPTRSPENERKSDFARCWKLVVAWFR